jgi:hypothetical protein
MPVTTEWGNDEHTIMIATIEWPWTWDELSAGWKAATDQIRSVPHPVHTIAYAKTTRFPVGNILSNLAGITKNVPDNIGLAIAVTENRFQETINTIFFKLSPMLRNKGHVVNSLEKAYALCAKEDANKVK